MNRYHGPKLEDHRTLGLLIALGAVFGAVAGAAIGAPWADAVHWMGAGVPVGISVGLAIGAVFSKPTRFDPPSGASTIPSTGTEDDRAPLTPRFLNWGGEPSSGSTAVRTPLIAAPIPPYYASIQRSSTPSASAPVAGVSPSA